tara:strand:+ start:2453 stop:3040 length:588 start_codon:yes stop_codon:yes gene_type:complete
MKNTFSKNIFFKKIYNHKLVTIVIIYILIILFQKKYHFFYPSIPIYPDNNEDVLIVKKYINKRTQKDIDLFKLTDESVTYEFKNIVNLDIKTLKKIAHEKNLHIKWFKRFFNRARPKQIDNSLNVLKSNTAATPSYPSGHAFQAYYLAKKLSIQYQHLSKQLWNCADKCAMARVYAGLHYPSDNEFSKSLVIKYF